MINLNYTFDSNEERHFYNWSLELYNKGYIEWIYSEQKTYLVFNKVYGYNPKQFTLIKDKHYTPDFIFKFSKKAYNLFYYDEKGGFLKKKKPFFYCNNNRGIMYIDVKGAFTRNLSSSITFPDRQSQMANRYNIYVQKTIPYDLSNKRKNTLFVKTFTPQSLIDEEVYKTTRKNKWKKGDSKLKYSVIKINDFL